MRGKNQELGEIIEPLHGDDESFPLCRRTSWLIDANCDIFCRFFVIQLCINQYKITCIKKKQTMKTVSWEGLQYRYEVWSTFHGWIRITELNFPINRLIKNVDGDLRSKTQRRPTLKEKLINERSSGELNSARSPHSSMFWYKNETKNI